MSCTPPASPNVSSIETNLRPKFVISRGDGSYVPLIAADELPEGLTLHGVNLPMSIEDSDGMIYLGEYLCVGRKYSFQAAPGVCLSVKPALTPNPIEMSTKPLVVATAPETSHPCGIENGKVMANPCEDIGSDSEEKKLKGKLKGNLETSQKKELENSRSGSPSSKKDKKTHCTYWVRTGNCDFMQQGCKYLHEIPTTLEELERIGFCGTPPWWRNHGDGLTLESLPRKEREAYLRKLNEAVRDAEGLLGNTAAKVGPEISKTKKTDLKKNLNKKRTVQQINNVSCSSDSELELDISSGLKQSRHAPRRSSSITKPITGRIAKEMDKKLLEILEQELDSRIGRSQTRKRSAARKAQKSNVSFAERKTSEWSNRRSLSKSIINYQKPKGQGSDPRRVKLISKSSTPANDLVCDEHNVLKCACLAWGPNGDKIAAREESLIDLDEKSSENYPRQPVTVNPSPLTSNLTSKLPKSNISGASRETTIGDLNKIQNKLEHLSLGKINYDVGHESTPHFRYQAAAKPPQKQIDIGVETSVPRAGTRPGHDDHGRDCDIPGSIPQWISEGTRNEMPPLLCRTSPAATKISHRHSVISYGMTVPQIYPASAQQHLHPESEQPNIHLSTYRTHPSSQFSSYTPAISPHQPATSTSPQVQHRPDPPMQPKLFEVIRPPPPSGPRDPQTPSPRKFEPIRATAAAAATPSPARTGLAASRYATSNGDAEDRAATVDTGAWPKPPARSLPPKAPAANFYKFPRYVRGQARRPAAQ